MIVATESKSKYFDYLPKYGKDLEVFLGIPNLTEGINTYRANVNQIPNEVTIGTRRLAEVAARKMALNTGMNDKNLKFVDVLKELRNENIITKEIANLFHTIRKYGNVAAHENGIIPISEAVASLVALDTLLRIFTLNLSKDKKIDPRANIIDEMFKKSDFAKYFNIYYQRPDIASKGGQAAFKAFSTWIIETWDKDSNLVNQEFYKEMVANIIMFKELDKKTKLGAGANGYKANINAYTLSYLYWFLEKKLNVKFNYVKIWQRQSIPPSVLDFMEYISYEIRDILTKVDGNVTEYAKRTIAWDDVKSLVQIKKHFDLSDISISKDEATRYKKEARKNEKFENDILDITLVYRKLEENSNYYKSMLAFIDGNIKEFLPKERDIIAMLATNKFLTDKQSKIALQAITKSEIEGFDL